MKRAAGASRTLWSTDPAWATAVPAPWAPKGLLVVSSVEGMDWRDSRERDCSLSFRRV